MKNVHQCPVESIRLMVITRSSGLFPTVASLLFNPSSMSPESQTQRSAVPLLLSPATHTQYGSPAVGDHLSRGASRTRLPTIEARPQPVKTAEHPRIAAAGVDHAHNSISSPFHPGNRPWSGNPRSCGRARRRAHSDYHALGRGSRSPECWVQCLKTE